MHQVCEPNASALRLARAVWPGPLTMVLPKKDSVPDIVTAGRDSVAVRVPSHPLFRRLLKLAALPLAAPSANPFGYVSPTTAAHVAHGLGKRIRYILDGGPTRIGVESTIIDLRDECRPRLLRPGAITRQQLETVLGRPVQELRRTRPRSNKAAQVAPGMLTRHYSPKSPVVLHDRLTIAAATRTPGEAFVFFRQPNGVPHPNVFWLDANGSLAGAARRVFSILRDLDSKSYRRIHVEIAPGDGLAEAINDRLRRAAAR